MYKCERCGQSTAPGDKMEKIVTETRSKVYMAKNKRGREYEAGRGWEIVKEIAVCPQCWRKYLKTLDEEVQ